MPLNRTYDFDAVGFIADINRFETSSGSVALSTAVRTATSLGPGWTTDSTLTTEKSPITRSDIFEVAVQIYWIRDTPLPVFPALGLNRETVTYAGITRIKFRVDNYEATLSA